MPPTFAQYGSSLEIRDIAKQALRYFKDHKHDIITIQCKDVEDAYSISIESLNHLVQVTTTVIEKYKESKK